MSFEGYYQRLCAAGHLDTPDVYSDIHDRCHCGQKYVWMNTVDLTNGSFDEHGKRIDGAVKLKSVVKKHLDTGVIEQVYLIPKTKGRRIPNENS